MLAQSGNPTAALDARLLTGQVLGIDALGLAIREHELVQPAGVEQVEIVMRRRMTGESVARIQGEREFYGLSFRLSPATLEPRPDTELLVDLALDCLPSSGRLLDMGTGTGCIPIAILANSPAARGLATDISAEALVAARYNAIHNDVADRLGFAQGDWFDALPGSVGTFDLVTANPPYIASARVAGLASEIKDFEPRLALDGGRDGLSPYRIIVTRVRPYLSPGGCVLVEIGYEQGKSVSELFSAAGFTDIRIHKDLAGLDRVIMVY